MQNERDRLHSCTNNILSFIELNRICLSLSSINKSTHFVFCEYFLVLRIFLFFVCVCSYSQLVSLSLRGNKNSFVLLIVVNISSRLLFNWLAFFIFVGRVVSHVALRCAHANHSYSWACCVFVSYRSVTVIHPPLAYTRIRIVVFALAAACFSGLLTCVRLTETETQLLLWQKQHGRFRCTATALSMCCARFSHTSNARTLTEEKANTHAKKQKGKKEKFYGGKKARTSLIVNISRTRQQYRPTIIQSYASHLPERMRSPPPQMHEVFFSSLYFRNNARINIIHFYRVRMNIDDKWVEKGLYN